MRSFLCFVFSSHWSSFSATLMRWLTELALGYVHKKSNVEGFQVSEALSRSAQVAKNQSRRTKFHFWSFKRVFVNAPANNKYEIWSYFRNSVAVLLNHFKILRKFPGSSCLDSFAFQRLHVTIFHSVLKSWLLRKVWKHSFVWLTSMQFLCTTSVDLFCERSPHPTSLLHSSKGIALSPKKKNVFNQNPKTGRHSAPIDSRHHTEKMSEDGRLCER